jgi:hypothetical protein
MDADGEPAFAVICAWCGLVIQEGIDPAEERISHGICERCAPLVIAQIEDRLDEARKSSRARGDSAGDETGTG